MQLEKILEEIDQKIAKVRSIPISEDEFTADGEEIYYNGKTQGRYEELIWCRNIILKHMNDGWISVDERMPEEDGFYVATMSGMLVNQEEPFVGLAEFEDGEWVDGDDVIAWRHLPEPYHPERRAE